MTPGSITCAYCGTTFVAAAPGAPQPPSGAHPEVLRLLRENKKIEAIRVYHQTYRTSLRDAKSAVDSIEAAMRGRS